MTKRPYYGHEYGKTKIVNEEYPHIHSIDDLYDVFKGSWCEKTCAPRMAKDWSKDDPSLGQCSITSFLVQDIIGGEVYGVKLPDGNFHCFNVWNGIRFDLTSEQFQDALDYENAEKQDRKVHFGKKEKYERYLLLKSRIEEKEKR